MLGYRPGLKTPGAPQQTERFYRLAKGSIVQRKGKKGTTYFVVMLNKWHRVPGKQTKQNAELYRAQLVTEVAQGEYLAPSKITLSDFVERWQAARFPEMTPNTQAGTRTHCKQYILPHLGARQLSSLSREDVQQWKAKLLGQYAPGTVETALNKLRTICRDAVSWRYIKADPTAGVKRPPQSKSEMQVLAPAQAVALLEAAPTHFWRCFFQFGIVTGLRIAELIAVKWEHLDLENARYQVTETWQARGKASIGFRQPKTAYSQAPVQLTPDLLRNLAEHRATQAAEQLKNPMQGKFGLMFPRTDGKPIDPRVIHRTSWPETLTAAGLPHMRLHDLRHTCAALWLDIGENPKFIQRQMRHASIKTTLDIYGHLLPERSQEAAARFDQMVFGKTG